MFENFVQDLLSTVNKPEWPSSELLLSLLGKILVKETCLCQITFDSEYSMLFLWNMNSLVNIVHVHVSV